MFVTFDEKKKKKKGIFTTSYGHLNMQNLHELKNPLLNLMISFITINIKLSA